MRGLYVHSPLRRNKNGSANISGIFCWEEDSTGPDSPKGALSALTLLHCEVNVSFHEVCPPRTEAAPSCAPRRASVWTEWARYSLKQTGPCEGRNGSSICSLGCMKLPTESPSTLQGRLGRQQEMAGEGSRPSCGTGFKALPDTCGFVPLSLSYPSATWGLWELDKVTLSTF